MRKRVAIALFFAALANSVAVAQPLPSTDGVFGTLTVGVPTGGKPAAGGANFQNLQVNGQSVLVNGSQINLNLSVNHTVPLTYLGAGTNTFNTTDYVGSNAPAGVQSGILSVLTDTGPGPIGAGGHDIAMLGIEYHAGSFEQNLIIGVEGATAVTGGGGAVTAFGVAAHFLSASANVGQYASYGEAQLDGTYTGTVGAVHGLLCSNWTGELVSVTSRYCVQSSDPERAIQINGQYFNALLQELSPSQAPSEPTTGRYYYGDQPSGSTGNVTMAGVAYFAPFHLSARTAFSKVTIGIANNVAAATCAVGIYPFVAGQAFGPALVTYTGISAATVGTASASGTANLNAGEYLMALQCSSGSVVVSGYHDNAFRSMFGTSSFTTDDYVPLASMTYPAFPSSPTLTMESNASFPNVPQIALTP